MNADPAACRRVGIGRPAEGRRTHQANPLASVTPLPFPPFRLGEPLQAVENQVQPEVEGRCAPRSPDFSQLNYGYWLTSRDAVAIEAITWKYDEPLGIPYGPSKGSADEAYPGHVREYGVGVAYQRLLWGKVYSEVHALPLLQHYFDESGARIQNGFELFLTQRTGYHLEVRDRFFLEPSIAFTHWPIKTNVPAAFEGNGSRVAELLSLRARVAFRCDVLKSDSGWAAAAGWRDAARPYRESWSPRGLQNAVAAPGAARPRQPGAARVRHHRMVTSVKGGKHHAGGERRQQRSWPLCDIHGVLSKRARP